MLPVFKPGQVAVVFSSPVKNGDCAVYFWRGRELLHRVLKTSADGAWFGDDAGRLEPHFVPWKDVRGLALGGPLAGGLPGLVYSRLRRALYRIFS